MNGDCSRCGHAAAVHLCPSCAAQAGPPVVPLDRAALCLDCDSIYLMPAAACPACGSRHAYTIARALQRQAA